MKQRLFIQKPKVFRDFPLPNSVFAYDCPLYIRRIFHIQPKITTEFARGKTGHQLKANQFHRRQWEVRNQQIGPTKRYVPLYNGGPYSPLYLPDTMCVFWNNGSDIVTKHKSTYLRSKKSQLKFGLGWGERGEFIDTHVLLPNHFFTHEGNGLFPRSGTPLWAVLALFNSIFIQSVINLYCGQHKMPGYVNLLPSPGLSKKKELNTLADLGRRGYFLKASWYQNDETNYQFVKPWVLHHAYKPNDETDIPKILDNLLVHEVSADKELEIISQDIDSMSLEIYGVNNENDRRFFEHALQRRPKAALWKETHGWSEEDKKRFHVEALLSFWVGCIFGRWDGVNGSFFDERLMTSEGIHDVRTAVRQKAQELWEKDDLASEPTKFLLTDNEIKKCPIVKYPYEIDQDGIIPLDEGHPEDLVKAIEKCVQITFGSENVEAVTKEIERLLGQSLRKYFKKSFFINHCHRYLKLPIYWLLQSASGSFGIYVYYHKITSDTLYKITLNYVAPKLNLLSNMADELTTKIESSEGQTRRQFEKEKDELERQFQDVSDFKDKIGQLIGLGFQLDIDDGIAVNLAPFKELVHYQEIEKYWENLNSGKCDWSKLALQLWPERVKKKCEKDNSLALAHNLTQT